MSEQESQRPAFLDPAGSDHGFGTEILDHTAGDALAESESIEYAHTADAGLVGSRGDVATDADTPRPGTGGYSTELIGSDSIADNTRGGPATSPGDAHPAKTRVKQYELIRELGRGGMGVVYLARDTKLARRVAIKFLFNDDPQLTARFLVEARTTAQFNHENIVTIHDVDAHDNRPFMVLEYLRGQSLKQLLGGTPMPPHRAVELMVPVVRALVCAHEHDVVHRDLKPENVFLTEAGTVKVLDFGIAKLMMDKPTRATRQLPIPTVGAVVLATPKATGHGALVGTIPYMSPEQWGSGRVDHRTDIWAVGIMLYEMVTGRHPLNPKTARDYASTADLDVPMPGVRDSGVPLPGELADLIDGCLVKRKAKRIKSAAELLDGLERLLPTRHRRRLQDSESPYPGLMAFQESDADRYFGRSRDIAKLLTRLRNQPLVGVTGPTGIGKSSFVRAGVVPALKGSGQPWEVFIVRPGREPLAALARTVLPMITTKTGTEVHSGAAYGDLSERLLREPGYLGSLLRGRAHEHQCRILLIADPYEELYTLNDDPEQRQAFNACLSGAADDASSPVRVIVSMRSDFLDRAASDRHFMADLTTNLMFLLPPDRDGLEEALTHPAELAGYRFENRAMVDEIVAAAAATSGSLPLLQFAARRLWEARDRDEKLLTEKSYREIGGIVGALASHADEVVSTVARLSGQAQTIVRAIFLRLVTPERTRVMASMGELRELHPDAEEVERILSHLIDARLLVVQSGNESQGATVEIVHDSLIHSWPMLRRWLDDSEDDAAFLSELRTAARQWQSRNRPQGLLWRGESMEEARRWRQRYSGTLASLESDYLDAVFALANRAARRRRIMFISTLSFLTLLVAVGAVGLYLIRQAELRAQDKADEAMAAYEDLRRERELLAKTDLEKQRAERKADRMRGKVKMSAEALARTNLELADKVAELEKTMSELGRESERTQAALRVAEAAKKKAQSEARKAQRAAKEAKAANAELRRTKDRLEKMIKRERRRRERRDSKLGPLGSDTLE